MSPDLVEVSVEVAASAEQAFAFFTDAEKLVEWMGSEATLDPVPGGSYRVRMGDGFAAAGEFVALDPPRSLSFTWGWAAGAGQAVRSGAQPDDLLPPGSTRVEVKLEPAASGMTRVHLAHYGLPSDQLRADHGEAWTTYLDRLVVRAAGREPGPDPHPGDDYTRTLHTHRAAPEAVFDALTEPAAVAMWWSTAHSAAHGSAEAGGELVVEFSDQSTVMRVDVATRATQVVWSVVASKVVPDWVGTTIHFDIGPERGRARLDFRHQGLTPQLECFDMCRAGWDQYLPRLIAYADGTLATKTGE